MKVTKVTREYWVLDGETIYFNEPLDHDLTVNEMQKLWDQANAHIAVLLQRTADRKEKQKKDKKDK
jgi:hypothetical protein